MVTQRAILVGFVGFCFYLIALVNSLPPLYYTLAWLSVGLIVSSFGVTLLSLQGLTCRWRVAGGRSGELLEDESISQPGGESGARLGIELSNAGTLNKTGVAIVVRFYDVRRNRMRSQRFLVEALPSGASLSSELPLHAPGHGLPRGRYYVSDVWIIGADVLGLFRARKRADAGLMRVRLFNDTVTPLASVVSILEKVTGHEHEVCVGVAAKVHMEGSATIFRGMPEECHRIVAALRAVGLRAEETPDSDERRWRLTRRRPLVRQRRVQVENRAWSGRALDALARRAELMPGAGFELVIGPAMVQPRNWVAFSSGAESREGIASRLPGQGEEFKGTRAYTAGDDLRRVHWASSARRGELVVREFLRPTQEGSLVIWDGVTTQAVAADLTAPQDEPSARDRQEERDKVTQAAIHDAREEAGLRLVASLCRTFAERGRPCGLLRLDARPFWLPPTTEGAHSQTLARVIECLADARADRTANLGLAMRSVLGSRVEGEVFLVTTAEADQLGAVHEAVKLWRGRGAQVHVAWVAPPSGTGNADKTPLLTPSDLGVDVILRTPAVQNENNLVPVREALSALFDAPFTAQSRGQAMHAAANGASRAVSSVAHA